MQSPFIGRFLCISGFSEKDIAFSTTSKYLNWRHKFKLLYYYYYYYYDDDYCCCDIGAEVHIVFILSPVQHCARTTRRRYDWSDVRCARQSVECESNVDCSAAVWRHHCRSVLRRRDHHDSVCHIFETLTLPRNVHIQLK